MTIAERALDMLPMKRRTTIEARLRNQEMASRSPLPPTEPATTLLNRTIAAEMDRLVALRTRNRLGAGEPVMNAKLAAYLAARDIDGRRVYYDELCVLIQASDSIAETQRLLSFGRGNVEHDLQLHGNEPFYRVSALKAAEARFSTVAAAPADRAGFYVYAGAGNCAEFSDVLIHVHAAKLAPGEVLHVAGNPEEDHDAVVLLSRADGVHVLLDAWGDGCAINVADSRYHRNWQKLDIRLTVTWEMGKAVSDRFRTTSRMVESPIHTEFNVALEQVRQRVTTSVGGRDNNVVAADFSARVAQRVSLGENGSHE